MNKLRPTERAYIAGFFDGEGCITFRKDSLGRPRISMSQKKPDVLWKIQQLLGYGHVRAYTTSGGGSYRLDISSAATCEDFVSQVIKYAVVKRPVLLRAQRWFKEREQ